jgi:hypothetical protein
MFSSGLGLCNRGREDGSPYISLICWPTLVKTSQGEENPFLWRRVCFKECVAWRLSSRGHPAREKSENKCLAWIHATDCVKVHRNRLEDPEGVRVIALLFLDLGARRGWMVSTKLRPLYPRERPGTHCTGGWVGPRAGLDVCEKLAPTGITNCVVDLKSVFRVFCWPYVRICVRTHSHTLTILDQWV